MKRELSRIRAIESGWAHNVVTLQDKDFSGPKNSMAFYLHAVNSDLGTCVLPSVCDEVMN
jgi:hypothetical protein